MTQFEMEYGLSEGDNVAVRIGESIKFFKIVNKDNILYLQSDIAAVAANTTATYAELTVLNPPDDQLYQIYRVELVLGNILIQIRQPASTSRLGVERSPDGGFITDKNHWIPLNIWIMEDFPPSYQLVNNTSVSITPVLRWIGWRYQVKPLAKQPDTYKLVNIGGIAR